MKKTILISGANGFIGTHFIKRNYKKYNFYGLINKNKKKIKGVKYIKIKNFYKKISKKIDIIIHLAQSKNYKKFPYKAKDIFNSNIKLTAEILEFARINKIKKFIYLSSGSVYDNSKNNIINEKTNFKSKKIDYYSASKISSEFLIKSYQNFFDIVNLRIFFPYGVNQGENMLIPSLIKNIKNNNKIFINNNLKFNPIYIDDLVKSIERSFKLKGLNEINIAGNETTSIEKLIKVISNILDKKPLFKKISIKSDKFITENKMAKKKLLIPKISILKGISFLLKENKN